MQKLLALFILLTITSCNSIAQSKRQPNPYYSQTVTTPLNVTNEQWKKILSPGVYEIAREAGTERAYTGATWNNHKKGTYYCAVCGNRLFSSDTKFESGTGWPSFYQPYGAASVKQKTDPDGDRVEVECARCGSHLGHVFNDGPMPTGKRFCMNSAVLDFVPAGK